MLYYLCNFPNRFLSQDLCRRYQAWGKRTMLGLVGGKFDFSHRWYGLEFNTFWDSARLVVLGKRV